MDEDVNRLHAQFAVLWATGCSSTSHDVETHCLDPVVSDTDPDAPPQCPEPEDALGPILGLADEQQEEGLYSLWDVTIEAVEDVPGDGTCCYEVTFWDRPAASVGRPLRDGAGLPRVAQTCRRAGWTRA